MKRSIHFGDINFEGEGFPNKIVQCTSFIIPYLKSIGMDHVISESCNKGTTLQRNHTKMTFYDNFPITVKTVLSGHSQIR